MSDEILASSLYCLASFRAHTYLASIPGRSIEANTYYAFHINSQGLALQCSSVIYHLDAIVQHG